MTAPATSSTPGATRRVVVPLDGSPLAESVLPIAASIARDKGASLELVRVVAPLIAAPGVEAATLEDEESSTARYREAADYLAATGDHATEVHRLPVKVTVLRGRAVDALAAHADGAALVVMTTHGRGGLSRAWLGSVTDGLVRRLECPVLVVRPHEGEAVEVPFRRVLVPVDGSGTAEQVIEDAVWLAGPSAEYVLLSVVTPVTTFLGVLAGHATGSEVEVESMDVAARYLDGLAQRVRPSVRHLRTEVLLNASPWSAILTFADEEQCDLIAMATTGRSGVRRLGLGSVADKVLRSAGIPVLLRGPRPGPSE